MKKLQPGVTNNASSPTQWVAIDSFKALEKSPSTLTVKVGDVSIEILEGFDRALFTEVLQILQTHAK